MSDLFGRIRVEQLGSGILGPPPPRGEEGNEKRDLFGRKEIIIPKEMQISCKSFEPTVRENRVIFVLSSRGKKRKGKEKKKKWSNIPPLLRSRYNRFFSPTFRRGVQKYT